MTIAGSLAMAGCATLGSGSSSLAGSAREAVGDGKPAPKVDPAKLAAEGIQYLQQGDEDRALRLFNAAIKFDPERAEYHLLAGIAYHLHFLIGGSHEMRDSAEIGYMLAARFSPRSPHPWIQLGRLRADAKQYDKASLDFAKAAELRPGNPDALYGLAMTSYLSGDLKTALWATDELDKLRWDGPAVNRMRAVLFTAGAEPEAASRYRNAYAGAISKDDAGLRAFDERLAQIKSLLDGQNWLTPPGRAKSVSANAPIPPVESGAGAPRKPDINPAVSARPVQLAQAGAPPTAPPGAPPMGMPGAPPMEPPGAPPMGMPGAPPMGVPGAAPVAAERDRARKSWFDCAANTVSRR